MIELQVAKDGIDVGTIFVTEDGKVYAHYVKRHPNGDKTRAHILNNEGKPVTFVNVNVALLRVLAKHNDSVLWATERSNLTAAVK